MFSDESKLVKAAVAGEMGAFEKLVKNHKNLVVSLAFKIVGNPEDAKDVAQTVFLRLFRFLPTFNRKTKFTTWLSRIVINASYDCLRARNRFQTTPIESFVENTNLFVLQPENNNELQEKIKKLLNCLSTQQKATFVLRDIHGYSVKETSDILEVSAGTIKSHLHYARKKLKTLLEKHYPDLLEGSINVMHKNPE